jgi:hypothetical protein
MRSWKQIKSGFSGYFGKRLAHAGGHQPENRLVLETVRVTKSELVNVGLQILPADAVVCPVDGSFQLAPKSVDCLRVDLIAQTCNNLLVRQCIYFPSRIKFRIATTAGCASLPSPP